MKTYPAYGVAAVLIGLFASALSSTAFASDAPVPPPQEAGPKLGPAFEVNLLWPFFPGGFTDLKLVLPSVARGAVVLGLHSDFGWRNAREDDAGKVATLATKIGYRQFFFDGVHLDATVNLGWRQERNNPYDGKTLNAFVGRLWTFAGYQYELSERWYLNARAGVGLNLWRTDRYGDKEKTWIPAGDLNLGVRF